jgi:hypothetical protein
VATQYPLTRERDPEQTTPMRFEGIWRGEFLGQLELDRCGCKYRRREGFQSRERREGLGAGKGFVSLLGENWIRYRTKQDMKTRLLP